jgi:hypothetical protein
LFGRQQPARVSAPIEKRNLLWPEVLHVDLRERHAFGFAEKFPRLVIEPIFRFLSDRPKPENDAELKDTKLDSEMSESEPMRWAGPNMIAFRKHLLYQPKDKPVEYANEIHRAVTKSP